MLLLKSLPSRGAWIEIVDMMVEDAEYTSRSPHGERGLKFHGGGNDHITVKSLPSRGAWIEIPLKWQRIFLLVVAPLTGSVD